MPSDNPYIRRMQKLSWEMQPIFRAQAYLSAVTTRLNGASLLGVFEKKTFVHWDESSYKYDMLEEKVYKQAFELGKIKQDLKISDPPNDLNVFIYNSPADRAYVDKEFGIKDIIELPNDLQKTIEEIKKIPFPEK